MSLLSVATLKCNVGLMYIPHILDLDKGENNEIDNEDKYSLGGYSYICGILRFMNKVFYLIGSYQSNQGWEGWVFLLLGESPPKSAKMKENSEEFLKRIFVESPTLRVIITSFKQFKEWKWDQDDTSLWYNIDYGMHRPDHGAVPFPYLFPKSFEGSAKQEVSSKMKDSSQMILHLFRVLKKVCDGRKSDSRYATSSLPNAFTPVIEALENANECAEHVVAGIVLDIIAECIVEGDARVSVQGTPFQDVGCDGGVVAELNEMSTQLKGTI
jgi:hypothetical protein